MSPLKEKHHKSVCVCVCVCVRVRTHKCTNVYVYVSPKWQEFWKTLPSTYSCVLLVEENEAWRGAGPSWGRIGTCTSASRAP